MFFSSSNKWLVNSLSNSFVILVNYGKIQIFGQAMSFFDIKTFIFEKNTIWQITIKIGTSSRRSSRSVFGRSTGNDISGHYK